MARYPSFLKKEPLIWGISLSDIFKLSFLIFAASAINLPQEGVLAGIVALYGGLITKRKLFPRRHFEFLLKKKDRLPLHLALTNLKRKIT